MKKKSESRRRRPSAEEVGSEHYWWARLAGALRLPKKKWPPALHKAVEMDGYVSALMNQDDPEVFFEETADTIRGVRDQLKRDQRRARLRRHGVGRRDVPVGIFISPPEQKRAEVLARELARLALDHCVSAERDEVPLWQTVGAFRIDCFGGKTLSARQFLSFAESEALAYLDFDTFRQRGIPFVGHTSEVRPVRQPVARDSSEPCDALTFQFEWQIAWQAGSGRMGVEHVPYLQDKEMRVLQLNQEGLGRRVYPKSVLDEVRKLVEALVDHFLWNRVEALRFVACGDIPSTPSVTAWIEGESREGYVHLHIEAQQWTRAKVINAVFRHLQKTVRGKANRSLTEATLSMLDFVAERRHRGMSWRSILKQWNEQAPRSQRYRPDDVRNFERDFSVAYAEVVPGHVAAGSSGGRDKRTSTQAPRSTARDKTPRQ